MKFLAALAFLAVLAFAYGGAIVAPAIGGYYGGYAAPVAYGGLGYYGGYASPYYGGYGYGSYYGGLGYGLGYGNGLYGGYYGLLKK